LQKENFNAVFIHQKFIIMLDAKVIAVVKSTVPVLAEHGLSITEAFYKRLFSTHPELKNVFNQSNQREGKQPMALANAVYAAAAHIDNLAAILPAVQHIGHKHRSLNVKAEHYPIVGENLLAAIKEVLGDAATDDIISAWGAAYGVIAQAFINMESAMYADMLSRGGWEGYKPFLVEKKVKESDVITSFYLRPQDGKPLPLHLAGQYISVLGENLHVDYTQPRQYSLSMQPNTDFYRISVKREDGSLVSQHLHEQINVGDVLQISAPAGNFTLDSESQKPLVLLSGGIGITPLLSMLYAEASKNNRKIIMVQSVDNGNVHAFGSEIKTIAAAHDTVENVVFYQHPTDSDRQNKSFDFSGLLSAEWALANLPTDADFYFCGPIPFMQHVKQMLLSQGVAEAQLHYEIFGPAVGM
jgi:nitric oxide dioxygenase